MTRLYESNVQYYAAGGHLLDVNDVVEKMRREPQGIFESSMAAVLYKGRAMGVPLAVNPWPVHARLDLLEQAKVEYPKTWDEFIETSKKIQSPPRLFAFGMCLGLVADTTDNVMNLLWCYGGKMVLADNKTVVMSSPENVAGVKVIEAMFKTHKIIPPGAISWDNSGNNKAYQSKQAAFVMNPSSIYAYLDGNDKDLQKVTGLFPVPAGPKGTVNQIDTWAYGAFKKNPYPELAKGLLDYFMQPANYDKIVQSTGGRWVPVYKRLFDSPFWKEKPAFKHFIRMAETGVPVSYAGSPTPAAGEVLNTHGHPQDDPARPRRQLGACQGARRVPQEDRRDLRALRKGVALTSCPRPPGTLRTSTTTRASSPATPPSSDSAPGGSGPRSMTTSWRCCPTCRRSAGARPRLRGRAARPSSRHGRSRRGGGRRRLGADAGSGASRMGPSACDLPP